MKKITKAIIIPALSIFLVFLIIGFLGGYECNLISFELLMMRIIGCAICLLLLKFIYYII